MAGGEVRNESIFNADCADGLSNGGLLIAVSTHLGEGRKVHVKVQV